jgi:membrane protease subunit HflC
MSVAKQRVQTIVRSSIRDVVTQYELEEIVRSTDRALPTDSSYSSGHSVPIDLSQVLPASTDANRSKGVRVGRREILQRIKEEATRRLASKTDGDEAGGRGIELLDVGISRIAFVSSVRQKTFERWIAERSAISARNINEGSRLKAKIVNESKAEVARIEGQGQQQASELKGKADAAVIKLYADAMQQTGDFYSFVRTLQAYEESIGPDTQLILSTDSPFFQLFKELKKK